MTISTTSETKLHRERKHAAKQAKHLRRDLERTEGEMEEVLDRATDEYVEEGRLMSLERSASHTRTNLERAESKVESLDHALVG